MRRGWSSHTRASRPSTRATTTPAAGAAASTTSPRACSTGGRRRADMRTDVRVETTIERDRGDVAAYAMDPANDATWIGALTEVSVLTEGPVGEGTRVRRVARFLGKRIEYVNEIVEFAP